MTARLPVQNAIGRPSASSTPSEPNSSSVSHAISISKPMAQAFPRVTRTMSLMSLAKPCSRSSAAPIGIISFTGQYWMPHSVNETSPTPAGLNESSANRPLVQNSVPTKMKKKTEVKMSAIGFAARRELGVEHVDAHVLVALIGVGAGQHVLHAVHEEHALVQPVGR